MTPFCGQPKTEIWTVLDRQREAFGGYPSQVGHHKVPSFTPLGAVYWPFWFDPVSYGQLSLVYLLVVLCRVGSQGRLLLGDGYNFPVNQREAFVSRLWG